MTPFLVNAMLPSTASAYLARRTMSHHQHWPCYVIASGPAPTHPSDDEVEDDPSFLRAVSPCVLTDRWTCIVKNMTAISARRAHVARS
ncbi:hypothetical protein EDB86DRAFT_2104849 [Lactarius hatsudake]|nr:hypothetical protein EDB86DRAFT_2104849 [Lactarius hatsudake]